MTTTVTDLRYGRRGGGWADGDGNTLDGPPCDLCGQPMLGGQRGRHFVCCAAQRGDQPGPVCNEVAVKGKDEPNRCGHCWAPAK